MKGKIKYILCFLAIASIFTACKDDDSEPSELSASVRISAFSLTADTTILDNLNTVFFTIDLENGLIYNADSLPKGTDVSALAVTISAENASAINLTSCDTTFNYQDATSTKINFTSPVQVEVVSQSGLYKKNYEIKVNVHQIEADLLSWGGMMYSKLPGSGTLDNQRTVKYNNTIYMIMLRDGEYYSATTDRPSEGWTLQSLSLEFTPDIQSLQGDDSQLYILDTDGNLYTSTDGNTWENTGSQYSTLLGCFNGSVLALTKKDDTYYHDIYPPQENFVAQPVAEEFPVSGQSDMLTYNSSWMTAPQGMIVGGRKADGNLTGAMWGYDGTTWARLNNTLPEREGALFVQYVTFLVDDNWVTTEKVAWFVIGGHNEQSAMRDVWVSTNYGITWGKAADTMQLPGYITSRGYASAIVCDEPINATYSDWVALDTTIPTGYRLQPMRSAADENLVPYIYIFGGFGKDNYAFDQIWRGLINRLRFEPIP